jgi:hypothetical protein
MMLLLPRSGTKTDVSAGILEIKPGKSTDVLFPAASEGREDRLVLSTTRSAILLQQGEEK